MANPNEHGPDEGLAMLDEILQRSHILEEEAAQLRKITSMKLARASREFRILGALITVLLLISLVANFFQWQTAQDAEAISKDNREILSIVENVTNPSSEVQRRTDQRFADAVTEVIANMDAKIQEEVQEILVELEQRGVIPSAS